METDLNRIRVLVRSHDDVLLLFTLGLGHLGVFVRSSSRFIGRRE